VISRPASPHHKTAHLTASDYQKAAGYLRRGGLVVFPTETVYGLGADAFQADAVDSIFAAKGRPADNPLIVHLPEVSWIERVAASVPAHAELLFRRFSPGPLTLILPRLPELPAAATAGLPTVGVRIPSHPVCRKFLIACGTPVAAPSANRSGRPSPTDAAMARREMDGRVHAILDGGPCEHGLESTVALVEERRIVVLREGAVTREMMQGVLGRIPVLAPNSTAEPELSAASPGTRHAHYKPAARVVLFEAGRLSAALAEGEGSRTGVITLMKRDAAAATGGGRETQVPGGPGSRHLLRSMKSVEDYAHSLYRTFVEFDHAGCDLILAELPPAGGIGAALRDRLRRAAGQE